MYCIMLDRRPTLQQDSQCLDSEKQIIPKKPFGLHYNLPIEEDWIIICIYSHVCFA